MGKNLQTLQSFITAWKVDWETACRAFVADDFVCIEPPELPQGGTFTGWDAPIQVSNIYLGLWDLEVLDYQFIEAEESDVVVSRYLMAWTSKATRQSFAGPVIELNHIENGKITKMEVFHFDAAGLLATLPS